MTEKDKKFEEKSSFKMEMPHFDPQASIKHIEDALRTNQPAIIYGPPGTGKTKIVLDIVNKLTSEKIINRFESVQFHKKFSYEDFIEGFAPSATGFEKRDGVFKKFCKDATGSGIDVFLIDEINRADIASTFGEVLYAIEDRDKRSVKTAHFQDAFSIPQNLSVIGTMNTADRNISNIDFAIRRRFKFISLFPDETSLKTWLNQLGFNFKDFSIDEYCTLFQKLNNRIKRHSLLGPHMQLGQALFVPVGSKKEIALESLVNNFSETIIPQIESYFGFGNITELKSILNPLVAEQFLSSRCLEKKSFIGFLKETINEK